MSSSPENSQDTTALKRALFALKDMRARLAALENKQVEPLAIIGLSCRFPGGANTPEAFWDLLRNGRDAITDLPPDRWDIDTFYDPNPDVPGKMISRQLDRFLVARLKEFCVHSRVEHRPGICAIVIRHFHNLHIRTYHAEKGIIEAIEHFR